MDEFTARGLRLVKTLREERARLLELASDSRDDWPRHQPEADLAPIPGRRWYAGCDDGSPRVRPYGVCEGCGKKACPECGRENCPDHPWAELRSMVDLRVLIDRADEISTSRGRRQSWGHVPAAAEGER